MFLQDEQIIEVMRGVIDDFLKPKFISLGMNASGQWLNSLEARANNGNGEIWGMDYTYWLNNGRGPNKDQSAEKLKAWAFWYGINVIKPWAVSKGIVFDNPIAVAYNIAKNGTKKRPERIDFLDILESNEVRDYINKKLVAHILSSVQIEMVKRAKDTLITV